MLPIRMLYAHHHFIWVGFVNSIYLSWYIQVQVYWLQTARFVTDAVSSSRSRLRSISGFPVHFVGTICNILPQLHYRTIETYALTRLLKVNWIQNRFSKSELWIVMNRKSQVLYFVKLLALWIYIFIFNRLLIFNITWNINMYPI